MIIEATDLRGHTVVVLGDTRATRNAIRRYRRLGAEVLGDAVPLPGAATAPRTGATPWWEAALPGASLLVVVGEAVPGAEEAARAHRVLLLREAAAPDTGCVTLLGGGPGALDLLTLRGLRALAGADIVFHDRLGPGQEVGTMAPAAQLVDVGKLPGHHRVPQVEIERILVEAALAGKNVVRLKGGDPFVFGRGGEEVAACVAAGVPVTVIPGISSAVSVPGAAGIPVTHRGVSKLFTVVSGHDPFTEQELGHLAGLGGTIVVLMGVATLGQTAAGLLRHGLDPATPAAIIERGSTPSQRTTTARLDDLAGAALRARCHSPAVIVIGGVAALGEGPLPGILDVAGAAGAPA